MLNFLLIIKTLRRFFYLKSDDIINDKPSINIGIPTKIPTILTLKIIPTINKIIPSIKVMVFPTKDKTNLEMLNNKRNGNVKNTNNNFNINSPLYLIPKSHSVKSICLNVYSL